MPRNQESASTVIDAPAEKIFALLTDPAMHPLIDGTGSVLGVQGGSPYKILNEVVEYDQDRLIAWRHFYGHRWRWQLKPLSDGRTEVTETFDWSTTRFPLLLTLTPFPRRNRDGIEKSLVRLADIATAPGK
jgi:hypothetical protein